MKKYADASLHFHADKDGGAQLIYLYAIHSITGSACGIGLRH
ncbi:hypothetical protein [Bartonella sp. ML69XJBT]|nr:hypothetical protein [Bartonella sp. ML69XJBT]